MDPAHPPSQPADPGAPERRTPIAWIRWQLHRLREYPDSIHPGEILILIVVSGFFLLYGLVPYVGGDRLGLVGADEPRYAQIAREMLAAHNQGCAAVHAEIVPRNLSPSAVESSLHCLLAGTITPILNGKPWLEKPALYYWRAMGFFREFGVSDWSARLPSSSGAGFLVLMIFLHMRRFRPGGHLDAALITLSSLGIVAFARGASTDMQLAAPFCIGMLGWYAWYETGKKFWLFDLYFFGAAATLAKGPVAPFLALIIIFLFVALRREWTLLRRTIWLPGVLLYLVMVLPWYIAVQRSNPEFLRFFFLEHNLERFATNRFQHHQPAWYYLLVLVVALIPWTVLAGRALVDAVQISIAEWKVRRGGAHYLGNPRAGDAFPEFLVLWAVFPIVFFSFSGSKLPGYILPSIPPLTILTGDYLFRVRERGLRPALLWAHGALCAIMVFVLLLAPQHLQYETLVPPARWLTIASLVAIATAIFVVVLTQRLGLRQVRTVTLVPVIAMMIFLLGFHGRELDQTYSARPLAREIARLAPHQKILALLNVRRDIDYGLNFYTDRKPLHYDNPDEGVPDQEHILVVRASDEAGLDHFLMGRIYEPLFLDETQGLAVFRVYAKVAESELPRPPLASSSRGTRTGPRSRAGSRFPDHR